MAEQKARNLVLIGRNEASKKAREVLDQLEQAGTHVAVFKVDVSSREQVARMLESVKATMPPLRGIVHAAGVLDDGILQQQTWERFARVMAPKVEGTWNLHLLTQDLPLNFFVCFSSVASLLGSPGQGNYAAANAFMDALVHHRRAVGLPGVSINWGFWTASGMAASVGSHIQNRLAAQGVGTIVPVQGLQVLGELLRQDAAQVGVLPVNWSLFVQQFPAGGEPSWLCELARQVRQPGKSAQPPPAKKRELLRQWQDAIPSERHSLLTTYTQKLVAQVVGLSASHIDIQQPLTNLGVDSFMSIELKNAIKTNLDIDVPVVKFLEGISIATLGIFLDEQLTTVLPMSCLSRPLKDVDRVEGQL
jgi:hypothetical protein